MASLVKLAPGMVVGLFLSWSPAAASVITHEYVNNANMFRWDFTWDRVELEHDKSFEYRPPLWQDTDPWDIKFAGLVSGDDLAFASFVGVHANGPDPGDIDPGAALRARLLPTDGLPDTVATGAVSLLGRPRNHTHDPRPNHSDLYRIFYSKQEDGRKPVRFNFRADHAATAVPEPSVLLLVCSGLLGYGARGAWRHLRIRQGELRVQKR